MAVLAGARTGRSARAAAMPSLLRRTARTGAPLRRLTAAVSGPMAAPSCGCARRTMFPIRGRPTPRRGGGYRRWHSTDERDNDSGSIQLTPRLRARLQERLERYVSLLDQSSSVDLEDADRRKVAREIVQLEGGAQAMQQLCDLESEAKSLQALQEDPEAEDELQQMAMEELVEVDAARRRLEKQLLHSLIPKDDNVEHGNVILEIRAGAGGDEASIFAADLYNMYSKVGVANGWRLESVSAARADTGSGAEGFKEIITRVIGKETFSRLRFESGVHRVQRVPSTESKGRVHTSTASVAVMPEPTEVDRHIAASDLRIDFFRASGAGGQHVNTTESAVRVTHIPTGITAAIQDERSQQQNKAKALALIAARVYEARRSEEAKRRSASRRAQIGTGDRSERIRTYNYMQSRVTDHRIGLTIHGLDDMLEGAETFLTITDALAEQHLKEEIEALEDDFAVADEKGPQPSQYQS